MTFAQLNLDPTISKALQACGYKQPTPIQARSIPDILEGKDLVASAQTGTGKTAAFVLPALHRLSMQSAQGRKPRILILTPTRELASQITQAAGRYGKFLRFNMASLVGGMSYRQQLRDLSRNVDFIVATPGRLLDHMENRRLDLSGIEMLVLDEADRMLDMGFIDDVQAIANATPRSRQTLLFSATVDGKLSHVVKNLLNNPVRIDLSEKIAPAQIAQELYIADNPQHRAQLLQHMLDNRNIFKAIIFSATKIGADKLAGELNDQGYLASPLHGDLKQNVRNKTIERLRRGKIQFLVATDVAARGIDIADMTHVINYDLPRFCEDYVHRIGRTGRAGKEGVAISFALPSDARHVQRIERYIGNSIKLLTIEGLEPRIKQFNPNQPKSKKKNGKSKSGFGKSGFGKKPSYGRSEKSEFGRGKSKNGKMDRQESGRAQSRFDNSDRPEKEKRRPSFDKSENTNSRRNQSNLGSSERSDSSRSKSNFGKPERPESNRRKSSFENAERPESTRRKSNFDKSERPESNRRKSSFDNSERPESNRRKSSFENAERPESTRRKSNFDKSERPESNRRKSSFDNSERSESGRSKSNFSKSDRSGSTRGKSSFGKSERSESSRSKSNFGNSERSESPRTKSNFGRSERSESTRNKSKFSNSENSGKISYGKSARPGRGKPKTDNSSRTESGRKSSNFGKNGASKSRSFTQSDKVRYKSKKD